MLVIEEKTFDCLYSYWNFDRQFRNYPVPSTMDHISLESSQNEECTCMAYEY